MRRETVAPVIEAAVAAISALGPVQPATASP
jgi:hypothetical protein